MGCPLHYLKHRVSQLYPECPVSGKYKPVMLRFDVPVQFLNSLWRNGRKSYDSPELPLGCLAAMKKGKTASLRQINRPDAHFIACGVAVKQNGKPLNKCCLIKNVPGGMNTCAHQTDPPESSTMKVEPSRQKG